MKRGDIYQVNFGIPDGHTVALRRPALLLTDRPAQGHSSTVVVLPITKSVGQANLFTYSLVVKPSKANGLSEESLIQIEMIQVVNLTDVLSKRGQLEDEPLRTVIDLLDAFLIRR